MTPQAPAYLSRAILRGPCVGKNLDALVAEILGSRAD